MDGKSKDCMRSIYSSTLRLAFFVCVISNVEAKEMVWDDFKSGEMSNYTEGGGVNAGLIDDADGPIAMKIPSEPGTKANVQTLKTPVESGARYILVFTCAVDGPYTFERNPQLDYLLLMSCQDRREIARVPRLPFWRVMFHDRDGRGVSRGYNQFHTHMLHSGRERYVEEFNAPDGVEALSILFGNGNPETSITISDLNLEKIEHPKTLNVNGDFSLGRHGYSGWNENYKFSCRLRENPERQGDCLFDASKGISFGDAIQVEPNKDYTISYRFSGGPVKTGRLRIYFYGQGKTKLARAFTRIATAKHGEDVEDVKRFRTPANTAKIKIYLNGGIYDYVRISETNADETDVQREGEVK